MPAIPEKMKAVLLKGHGGFDQLEFREDVPVSRPEPGAVLVKIGAAGVNNTDINTRTAWHSRAVSEGTTVAGAISGPIVELDLRTLYLKDLRLEGCTAYEPQVFRSLVRYIERGEIRPVVANVYALESIVAAQREFIAKEHTGKIVLRP